MSIRMFEDAIAKANADYFGGKLSREEQVLVPDPKAPSRMELDDAIAEILSEQALTPEDYLCSSGGEQENAYRVLRIRLASVLMQGTPANRESVGDAVVRLVRVVMHDAALLKLSLRDRDRA